MIKVEATSVMINNKICADACMRKNIGTCAQISSYNGTANYNMLKNKPQINGIELVGNKSMSDFITLGNGLDFDTNNAIEIQNGVIFDCGTSTTNID